MRVFFLHIHVWDTVIILEEGNLPQPQCPWCSMLLTWMALNVQHATTTHCAKEEKWKRCRLTVEEMRESAVRAFQAYGRPLEMVTSFK